MINILCYHVKEETETITRGEEKTGQHGEDQIERGREGEGKRERERGREREGDRDRDRDRETETDRDR